ncbi:hypothetical protein KAU34_07540 [candidate division WOR-3 bacterium]|nr:hypothetical protein [candidate division WOR-3 bacterium]
MNYKVVLGNMQKVLKKFIVILEAVLVGVQVSHTNVLAISKELKKINYRLDRLRSDLKLAKEKKIDVSNSSGTDNGCKESDK